MQKEKMLRELYRGRLMPAEKSIVPGSEFQKQQYRLVEFEKKSNLCWMRRGRKDYMSI